MAGKTEIEWADATLNTAWGCTKVSKGCENCYMYRLSKAFGKPADSPAETKTWRQQVNRLGEPKIVFLNSMTDTFHESFSDTLIESWLTHLAATPHTFICLTKRTPRMKKYFESHPVPANFWIGTSIENRSAYHRLRPLQKIKAKTKFLSLEPLLESVSDIDLTDIQWVIVGGESDFQKPRPFDISWAAEIRDKCKSQSQPIPFFYKQSGGRSKTNGVWGSNILEGKTYLEMPELLKTKESTTVSPKVSPARQATQATQATLF